MHELSNFTALFKDQPRSHRHYQSQQDSINMTKVVKLQGGGALRPALILEHLIILTHAFECSKENCVVPNCRKTKTLINHLLHCNRGLACHSSACINSKQIIAHWNECGKYDCDICGPVAAAPRISGQPGFPTVKFINGFTI